MKFYLRTYILILAVIISSTLFSTLLLTDIIVKAEREEIHTQLQQEAATVLRNITYKEQLMWQILIGILNNQDLAAGIAETGGRPVFSDQGFINTLYSHIRPYTADYVMIRSGGEEHRHSIALKPWKVEFSQLYLNSRFPTVRYEQIGNAVYHTGSVVIEHPAAEETVQVIVIKEIDSMYAESLTYNTTSDLLLYHGNRLVMSTIPVVQSLFQALGIDSNIGETITLYGSQYQGISYNIHLQPVGWVSRYDSLLTAAVLHRSSSIENRNRELQTRLLFNLLAGALLASFITIFISRMVTKPMLTLRSGMGRIGRGDFSVKLPQNSRQNREVQQLYQGFNAMAAMLEDDRIQRQEFIEEITRLHSMNELIIEAMEVGIGLVEGRTRVVTCNRLFGKFFGLERDQLAGKLLADIDQEICSPEMQLQIGQILSGERTSWQRVRRVRNDRVFRFLLTAVHDRESRLKDNAEGTCLVVIEDVSRQTKLEEQLFQAEKISSLSILSAGVAHEINNPLTSILSNVQHAIEIVDERVQREFLPGDSIGRKQPGSVGNPGRETPNVAVQENLKWIEQEARRIAGIIRSMLDFSSPTGLAGCCGGNVLLAVGNVFQQCSMLPGVKGRIRFSSSIEDQLPLSAVSQFELRQILLNLVQNAIQAIRGSGEITITAVTWRDQTGSIVDLVIRDTGEGIAEEELPKIFDPFYTTKPQGVGTGLGLSVVYGLVKRYGGSVDVSSTAGSGTAFHLMLPAFAEYGELSGGLE